MQAITGINQIFQSSVTFIYKGFDDLCNVFIERIAKSAKDYAENTQDHTFYKPYYWKKVLINTLKRDFLTEETKEDNFNAYFVMDGEDSTVTNDWTSLINRYGTFINKCAEGTFFLSPRTAATMICDFTKDKDFTFYAFALVCFALPLCEDDEERGLILNKIRAQIPLINKMEKNTNHLYQKIFQEITLNKKPSFIEKKSCKNTKYSEISVSKTIIIGFVILSMLSGVHAAFNSTQFYQAAKDWNYSNGPFNVFNQLVLQKNCDPKDGFCEAPNDLVPHTITNLTSFYWDRLGLNLNVQNLLVQNNVFHKTSGSFQGNYTFHNTTFEDSDWDIYNGTHIEFDGCILNRMGFNLHRGNSSLELKETRADRWSVSQNNPETPPVLQLKISDSNITRSLLPGLESIVIFQNPKIENSFLNNTHIGGKIHKWEVNKTLMQSCELASDIEGVTFNECDIKNGTFGSDGLSINVQNCPTVEWMITNDGMLRESTFQNISFLKLTRKLNESGSEFIDTIKDSFFKNINVFHLEFEWSRLYAPVLENIKLLSGKWEHGRVGPYFPPCNMTAGTLKATNVFVNNFHFDRVYGGCMAESISANQAKKWFEKSGLQFGPEVVFEGYDKSNTGLPIYVIIPITFLMGASLVTLGIVTYTISKRRKGYVPLHNSIN